MDVTSWAELRLSLHDGLLDYVHPSVLGASSVRAHGEFQMGLLAGGLLPVPCVGFPSSSKCC